MARMFGWFVDDEKMGCLYLHWPYSGKSDCSSWNWHLERHDPSVARYSHIRRTEEYFENDMTKSLNAVFNPIEVPLAMLGPR